VGPQIKIALFFQPFHLVDSNFLLAFLFKHRDLTHFPQAN